MASSTSRPTIWAVPDDLWERIQWLLDEYDPPKPTGRKAKPARPILDAVLFRLRTGCQWNQLPKVYGDDSTIHRRFQHWVKLGLFELLWSLLVAECDELGLVHWDWQAADGSLGKAHSGGEEVGPNPTDRAKSGSKKSLLVDGQGGPLSLVLAAANVNDHLLLAETLDSIIVERPAPTTQEPQHLCLDGGYHNAPSREVLAAREYQGHIRPGGTGEVEAQPRRHRPRRWVVERTFAWLSKCRGLVIRYETGSENYLALLQLACGLLWYRRLPSPASTFS